MTDRRMIPCEYLNKVGVELYGDSLHEGPPSCCS
jgi:hypothetical protein